MAIARFDFLRTVGFATITAAYTPLGTPLARNWRAFAFTNTSNATLFISFDGTTDNIVIPANSFKLYDLAANSADVGDAAGLIMQLNTQISVKYLTAPTSGSVYVEALYVRNVL